MSEPIYLSKKQCVYYHFNDLIMVFISLSDRFEVVLEFLSIAERMTSVIAKTKIVVEQSTK